MRGFEEGKWVKWRRSVAAAFRSSRAYFGHERVCVRCTSLNLRRADGLASSVCGDTLGIVFCDGVVVFVGILVRFPCWLVQQWRPPCWHGLSACSATCAQSCATTRRIAVINPSISVSSHLVSMTSLAAVPRQPALDMKGRGPVAAVPANVNKQHWSILFDQLIVQQSLPRVSFQLDRCQQLDRSSQNF